MAQPKPVIEQWMMMQSDIALPPGENAVAEEFPFIKQRKNKKWAVLHGLPEYPKYAKSRDDAKVPQDTSLIIALFNTKEEAERSRSEWEDGIW